MKHGEDADAGSGGSTDPVEVPTLIVGFGFAVIPLLRELDARGQPYTLISHGTPIWQQLAAAGRLDFDLVSSFHASYYGHDQVEAGTAGVMRVLAETGMFDSGAEPAAPTRWSRSSRWMRASNSGVLSLEAALGDDVVNGDELGVIHDPFGKRLGAVTSRSTGVVVGHTQGALVNRGDAVVHVASIDETSPDDDAAPVADGD